MGKEVNEISKSVWSYTIRHDRAYRRALPTYDLDARGSPFSWIYVYPLLIRGADSAPVARVPQHRGTHNARDHIRQCC